MNRYPHVAYMIYFVNVMQYIWGICVLLSPELIRLAPIGGIHVLSDLGFGARVSGATVLGIALLATWGIYHNERKPYVTRYLMALMPQYVFTIFAAMLNSWIIVSGQYHGQEFDRVVLIALLSGSIVAAWYHSKGIVERHILWKRLSPLRSALHSLPEPDS